MMLKKIKERAAAQGRDPDVSYRQQADEEFYTKDALKARRRLRHHPTIVARTKLLWGEG